jgi:hypothetical protein
MCMLRHAQADLAYCYDVALFLCVLQYSEAATYRLTMNDGVDGQVKVGNMSYFMWKP